MQLIAAKPPLFLSWQKHTKVVVSTKSNGCNVYMLQRRVPRNHIPGDIQVVPELREIAGKLSIFALTEIRRQLILAKKEVQNGCVSVWRNRDRCTCHAYVHYRLPCFHTMPTDGSRIQLEKIAPMWRLDNWEQGFLLNIIANYY
jgi:hypothetical protein